MTGTPFAWSKTVVAMVLLPLIFELIFIAALFFIFKDIDDIRRRTESSVNLAFQSGRILSVTMQEGGTAMAARLGLLKNSRQKHKAALMRIDEELDKLAKLPDADESDRKFIEKAMHDFALLKKSMKKGNIQFQEGQDEQSTVTRLGTLMIMEQMISDSRNYREDKFGESRAREQEVAEKRRFVECLIVACVLFSFCVALTMAYLLNQTITRKVELLSENALRLAKGEALGAPLPDDDEFSRLDRSFREMALLVRATKAREKNIVDKAREMICSIDEAGTFKEVNPAAGGLLECAPDALVGRTLFEFMAPDEISRAKIAVENAVTKDAPVSLETALSTEGRARIDTSASFSYSKRDRTLVCVMHDISARKQEERARQDMVSMISHDLRTPLTSVRLALDLVIAGALGSIDEADRAELSNARAQSERVIKQINDLLDIEKLELGQMQLSMEATPLSEVLASAVTGVKDLFPVLNVEIRLKPTKIRVFADVEHLERVLVALLTNSVENSPPSSTIDIESTREDGVATVKVSDRGPLLSEEERLIFFERFKDEGSAKTRSASSSLSLPLCKAIMSAHSGEIGADIDGDRSVFWIKLRASARDEK